MLHNRCLTTSLIAIPILAFVGVTKPPPKEPAEQTVLTEDAFWVHKTFCRPTFDLVIMGDSWAYCGLCPKAMEAVLPDHRILNFAYSSGGLNPAMYREAERKLDPSSRRKVVLLAVTPLALTLRSVANGKFMAEKSRSREYVFEKRHPWFVWDLTKPIGRREIAMMLGRGSQRPERQPYSEYHEDGWAAVSCESHPDAMVTFYRELYSEHSIAEPLVAALVKQTEDWIRRGILVFGVRCPSSEEMAAMEDELAVFDEARFVSRFTSAGGVWLAPTGEYQTIDGGHMEMRSAMRFSTAVAMGIKARLAVAKDRS